MNTAEYAKALGNLPMNFKVVPYENIAECYHNGILFMCAGREMIQYVKGEWHQINFINNAIEDAFDGR